MAISDRGVVSTNGENDTRLTRTQEMTVAQRIKLVRTEKLQVDQRALARMLDVSSTAVSKWERGANDIEIRHLQRLAAIAEVDINWLVDGRDLPARVLAAERLLNMVGETEDEFFETFEDMLSRYFARVQRRAVNK